jgi:peptidoglycan/xylan/chitin deacetylase (PgdA/CDA1 family)
MEASSFALQLDAITRDCWRSIRLSDIADGAAGPRSLLLTFDDGQSSDFTIAAPELAARSLSAVFFVVWSFLDQPGFLTRTQLRELHNQSFEIGAHGLIHHDLSTMGPTELWREVSLSKSRLEDFLGKPVTAFAIPFGRYNDQVLEAVLKAGFERIMTSDIGFANCRQVVMPRLPASACATISEFQWLLNSTPLRAGIWRMNRGLRRRLNQTLFGRLANSPASS